MTRLPRLASLVQTSTTSSPRNCASSMPITSVRGESFSMISAALKTASEGMPRPECETISLAAYRSSIAGLKICTRWRAISARRNRRIRSSLLPENIGPTTTSIQPILPLTMSTVSPSILRDASAIVEARYIVPLLHRACRLRGAIHLLIIERREGGNHGNAKRFLPRDEVVRKHAPGALGIADADCACKLVDGYGKFHAVF